MIRKVPNDPRFHHGLALCFIARAYEDLFEKQVQKSGNGLTPIEADLDMALFHLGTAKISYEKLLQEDLDLSIVSLVEKNYFAILNSLADISVRKYKTNNLDDLRLLSDARGYIDLLKEGLKKKQYERAVYTTFLGTEIEIEYFEAKDQFSKNDLKGAHHKILLAQTNLGRLEQDKAYAITHPKFRDTTGLIQKLSVDIFNALERKY